MAFGTVNTVSPGMGDTVGKSKGDVDATVGVTGTAVGREGVVDVIGSVGVCAFGRLLGHVEAASFARRSGLRVEFPLL